MAVSRERSAVSGETVNSEVWADSREMLGYQQRDGQQRSLDRQSAERGQVISGETVNSEVWAERRQAISGETVNSEVWAVNRERSGY